MTKSPAASAFSQAVWDSHFGERKCSRGINLSGDVGPWLGSKCPQNPLGFLIRTLFVGGQDFKKPSDYHTIAVAWGT